jgi:hypothetical protein
MFLFTKALKTLPIALLNAVNLSNSNLDHSISLHIFERRFLGTGIIGVMIACIPIWKNANISQAMY